MLWSEHCTNGKKIAIDVLCLAIVLPKLFLSRVKSGKHKLLLGHLLLRKLSNRLLKIIKEFIADSKDKVDSDILCL
jgi:hypothetical protein